MVDEAETPTAEAEPVAADGAQPEAPESGRRPLSLLEKIVVGLCAVGVVAVTIAALEYSGISIVGHTIDVLSESWTQEATIGVTVALIAMTSGSWHCFCRYFF